MNNINLGSKCPIINENISKHDGNFYTNMKTISEFVIKYRAFLLIDNKIIEEIHQVLNSINIILSGVLKASTKIKELNQKNIKTKNPSDKCLTILECSKIELIKNKILNFDKKAASKILGCTDGTLSDIEKLNPKILKLIEELQIDFVSTISGEKKEEKYKNKELGNTSETIIEEDIYQVAIPEFKQEEITKIEIPKELKQVGLLKEVIDENSFYKNFDSKDINVIKDFYKTCLENNKKHFFVRFLDNLWTNKGNTYLKLQIIDFFIYENLDKDYIKKNLFIGLSSQVNINNDKEYILFEKVSELLFPKRKSFEHNPAKVIKATTPLYLEKQSEVKKEFIAEVVLSEKIIEIPLDAEVSSKSNTQLSKTSDGGLRIKKKIINSIPEEQVIERENHDNFQGNTDVLENEANISQITSDIDENPIKIDKEKTIIELDPFTITESLNSEKEGFKKILNELILNYDYKNILHLLDSNNELWNEIKNNKYIEKFILISLNLRKEDKKTKEFILFLDKYIINN